jgi:precorrin-4/cobalt-precorrin-4 C11-methyltransferase
MNKVYFVGAGPGDPGLLTRKGEALLAASKTVFVPPPYQENFASDLAGKTVRDPFDYYFDPLIEQLRSDLLQGDITFLVPGDLTFYAPFQAVVAALGELSEVIPGVGTANAAAAALKRTLDLPGVSSRTLLASPRTLGDSPHAPGLDEMAAPGTTLLLYMNNRPLDELCGELARGYGSYDVPIALLHRLGMEGERIVQGTLSTIVEAAGDFDWFNLLGKSRRPALTLVVVGEALTAEVDGSWWDYRRKHIWQKDGEAS